MKTKVKKFSKRSLAIVLGLLMIVSCLFVGSVTTTNAAENPAKLQTGSRFYFNAHGAFTSTKSYVYIMWVWNSNNNASIIRMDHIANTEWYTAVTADGNIVDGNNQERRGDVTNIVFFTDNASGWATKDYQHSTVWNHITGTVGSGYYVNIAGDSKLFHTYNNYVNYCDSTGRIEYKSSGDKLANDSGTLCTKSGQQKATVYTSTDGSTWSYNDRSTDPAKGGDVRVGGYGWSTAFVTTSKTFASASDADCSYSYFDKPVLTSEITFEVTDTYDGYYFQGWYEDDDTTLVSNDPTYTHQLTAHDSVDLHAHFLKPTYSEESPLNTDGTISNGTLLFDNFTQTNRAWIWGTGIRDNSNGWNIPVSRYGSSTVYYINNTIINTTSSTTNSPITTSYAPNAILTDGTGTNLTGWPGATSTGQSGTINAKSNANNSNAIYYSNNTTSWTNFDHLAVTAPTINGSSSAVSIETTSSAVALATTLSGTLKDASNVKFYYTMDNSTYYLISSGAASTNFYPPAYGKYKFIVTATDSAGIEKVRSATSEYLTVGSDGYFITGSSGLIGTPTSWVEYSSKGAMTNSSGTLWTKTFPNVSAGTYDFRIQHLTNGWTEYSDYTLTGNNVELSQGTGEDDENVRFTLSGKSSVTITFDATQVNSKYPVTVTVADVVAIPVSIYANTGGDVTVTYGSAMIDVAEGTHETIKVAAGETIDLQANPSGTNTFYRWTKNLDASYSTSASITDEEITKRTVFVANFATAGGGGGGTGGGNDGDYVLWYATNNSTGNSSSYSYVSMTANADGTYTGNFTAPNTSNFGVYINTSTSSMTTDCVDIDATQSEVSTDGNFNSLWRNNFYSGNTQIFYVGTSRKSTGGSVYVTYDPNAATSPALPSDAKLYLSTSAYDGGASGGTPIEGYTPILNYYAKDSAFAGSSKNTYFTNDTHVTAVENQVTVDSSESTYEAGYALKGSSFTVTTTISGTITQANNTTVNAKDKYYVAGFSFNGYTPEILEPNDTGVYTCTYTLPEQTAGTILEVTPIYFLKDDTYATTVYFNGFDDLTSKGWGDTLYVYPFYRYYISGTNDPKTKYEGQAENFGAYAGQPVINHGGQRYIQVPLTNDGTAGGWDTSVTNVIKGITLSNGYWDSTHKTCAGLASHKQTYDYDDFQKIYNENSSNLHSIFYSFKYKDEDTTNQHRLYDNTNGSSNTRKNDMMTSSRFNSSTVAAATLESYDSGNWEDLTDALGNKVDIFGNAVSDDSVTPLRVISMGYEYNNAGKYATEWAVYYKDGGNYRLIEDTTHTIDGTNADTAHNSSIVPSALVMKDKSHFSDYTAMDGDLSMAGYSKLYEALEAYAGVPVKITYEYEAGRGDGEDRTHRSDGRWTYTKDDDYVVSNIALEYKAKGASTYTPDTLSASGVGSATGAKAYFTNKDYYGKITSDSEIISNSEYYTISAEESGSYEFAGWFLKEPSGKESTISLTDKDTKTLRSGSYTLIARFDYVESGSLMISNSLANGQEGRGTTYLGVTAIIAGQETVLANVNSNTKPVKIGKDIIKSNSVYTLKIDVRTVPSGENTFSSYTCYTTDGSGDSDERTRVATANNIYDPANSSNTTDTYTITVGGDSSDLYTSGTQTVKAIEYISTLTTVHYTYTVSYNYTSRQDGDKTYKKTGTLNSAQIGDTDVVIGTLNTADKKLTSDFLATIAPHQSNFNKKIVWNTATASTGCTCTYTEGTNTYHITATVNSNLADTEEVTKTAYFTVPYAQTNGVASTKNDGGILYAAKNEDTTFNLTANFDNLVYTSATNLVTAPDQIRYTEGGNPVTKYFNYWQISTVADKRGVSRAIGRCYYKEFNYRLYDSYNVTAVYGDNPNYAALYAADKGTAISYIGSTRNQWNDSNGENDNDEIFNDFIVSFKPEGHALFNSYDDAEAGVIIQRVKRVDINSSGKNAKTLAEYAKEYSAEQLAAAKTAVENKLNGESYDKAAYPMVTRTIDRTQVNNKNRYLFTYARYDKENGVDKEQSMYLYRAYSYMKYNGGRYIVSNEPTYFCMYDIAHI